MAAADARPIPRKNVAYRVTFPILDADGDLVTGAASLDSEISKDGGTFADCTNEATEIATASGMYYLDLTSTEMNADTVAIIVKTGTAGAKTTPIVLYPQEAGDIKVDVETWLASAPDALVSGNVPADVQTWLGAVPAALTTDMVKVDVRGWLGEIVNALTVGNVKVDVQSLIAGAITAAAIATDAIGAAEIAAGAITADAFAAGAIDAAAIAANAIGASELAADAVTEIADGILTRAISNVEPAASIRNLYGAVAGLVNKRTLSASQIILYASDDTTVIATIPVTTNAALVPIASIDPP